MQTSTLLNSSALLGRPLVPKAVCKTRQARSCVVRADSSRPKWYPGADSPSYLNGEIPGDYGFDPLRLGKLGDGKALGWFREAELMNGRWAMAAVAGILFTELVGVGQPWWDQGAQAKLPLPLNVLILIEIVVFAVVEARRFQGWQKTGETGFVASFPFDPLGMRSDDTRTKEVKNGRLAMVAFVGFCSQAAVQGLGPIASLKKHLADPFHNNIYTSSVGKEFSVAIVALSLWPILVEASKSLDSGNDNRATNRN